MPDETQTPPVDRQGYVVVQNGDVTAKIVPSSVDVWTNRGWSVVDQGNETTGARGGESTAPDNSPSSTSTPQASQPSPQPATSTAQNKNQEA